MFKVNLESNEGSYAGLYAEPLFSLWGNGGAILEGLYHAFQPFGITLGDMRAETGSDTPGDESISVFFGGQALFHFKFDRIEASIANFSNEQLNDFSNVISRAAEWLHASAPGLKFDSHLFGYSCHCSTPSGSASDYLKSLQSPTVAALGQDRGTGLVFHAESPEDQRRVQFTVDHSLTVPDGLFVKLIIVSTEDPIQYLDVLETGRELLDSSLDEIGLTLERERGS